MNEYLDLALEAVLLLLVPVLPASLLYRRLPAKTVALTGIWKYVQVQLTGAAAFYVILVGVLHYCIIHPHEIRKTDKALTSAEDLNREQKKEIDRLNGVVSEAKGKEASTSELTRRVEDLTHDKDNLKIERDKATSDLGLARTENGKLEAQLKIANENMLKRRELWKVTGRIEEIDQKGRAVSIDTSRIVISQDRPAVVHDNGDFALWVYKRYNEAGGEEFPALKIACEGLWPANITLNRNDIGEFYDPDFNSNENPPHVHLKKNVVLRPSPKSSDAKRLGLR